MTTTDQDLRLIAEPSDEKGVWRIVAVHIGTLVVFAGAGKVLSSEWFRLWSHWNAEWVRVVVFIFFTSLASTQVAMLGAVAASSGRAILFRVRWLFRLLLVQWVCLTLPSVGLVDYWNFPLSLFLDQLLIGVSSFLVAGLVRLLSRRVLVRKSNPSRSSPERNQFSVADLLVLITCVAVACGVIRLFPREAIGLEGIAFAIIIGYGFFVGIPTGVVLPLLAWGFFTERDRPAERCRRFWIVLFSVAIAGIPLSLIIGSALKTELGVSWALISLGVLTALTATFITAIAFRRQGYRFQSRTRHDALLVPVIR